MPDETKLPDVHINLDGKKIAINATVLHKPGAVRLDAYPLLVYAPGQHGPGIRLEDHGTPVADIATKAAQVPDHEQLAAHFETTAEHIRQALRYAAEASNPVETTTKPGA